MSPAGYLVTLKEDCATKYYRPGAEKILGVGIVLSEFVTMDGELFYEVVWATNQKEYVRPSWLNLIKKNTSKTETKGV